MRLAAKFSAPGFERTLNDLPQPLSLDTLLPGDGDWHAEIGFGKGRYLLESAIAHPERRFLGIEVVSKYFRMLQRRAARHGVRNLLLVRGEALYLLATVLPTAFAAALHVYFPDPWPKARHHRRRLFDPETLDLVLGLLRPDGELFFATDFLDYGERVSEILQTYPGLTVTPHPEPWPDGARTNYEAKYIVEGRPILRLQARLDQQPAAGRLHPAGRHGIVAAPTSRRQSDPD
ncbi:MAG: hypothetical protein AAF657_00945 [Acidobacteriota bacterium]